MEAADETRRLAEEDGFIYRNAFAEGLQKMIANVSSVDFGHVIHLYFVGPGGGELLGAFRVIGPFKHPHPEWFGKAVTQTTLRTVIGGPLKERLDASKYEPDPQLKVYCGWPVVPDETRSPAYIRELFPGRNSLQAR